MSDTPRPGNNIGPVLRRLEEKLSAQPAQHAAAVAAEKAKAPKPLTDAEIRATLADHEKRLAKLEAPAAKPKAKKGKK